MYSNGGVQIVCVDGNVPLNVCRGAGDGGYVSFISNGVSQGDIHVTSGNVSIGAFTGNHYGDFQLGTSPSYEQVGTVLAGTGNLLEAASQEPFYELLPAVAGDRRVLGVYGGRRMTNIMGGPERSLIVLLALGNGRVRATGPDRGRRPAVGVGNARNRREAAEARPRSAHGRWPRPPTTAPTTATSGWSLASTWRAEPMPSMPSTLMKSWSMASRSTRPSCRRCWPRSISGWAVSCWCRPPSILVRWWSMAMTAPDRRRPRKACGPIRFAGRALGYFKSVADRCRRQCQCHRCAPCRQPAAQEDHRCCRLDPGSASGPHRR